MWSRQRFLSHFSLLQDQSMATGNGCAGGLSSGQGFGEDTVKMILKVNTSHQAEATLRPQAFLQLDDVN